MTKSTQALIREARETTGYDLVLINDLADRLQYLYSAIALVVPEALFDNSQQSGKEDVVTRLRKTRANMLGTDDEEHYWDCHDAAEEILKLRQALRKLTLF